MMARGLVELVTGDIGLTDFLNGPYIQEILTGGGLWAMRAGIAKK